MAGDETLLELYEMQYGLERWAQPPPANYTKTTKVSYEASLDEERARRAKQLGGRAAGARPAPSEARVDGAMVAEDAEGGAALEALGMRAEAAAEDAARLLEDDDADEDAAADGSETNVDEDEDEWS